MSTGLPVRRSEFQSRENDDLFGALLPMMVANIGNLPVVSDSDSRTLVGIISCRDIGRFIQSADVKANDLTAHAGQGAKK